MFHGINNTLQSVVVGVANSINQMVSSVSSFSRETRMATLAQRGLNAALNANPYIFKTKYDRYKDGVAGFKIDLNKNFRSRNEVINNINLIFNNLMFEDIGGANYEKEHQMVFGNAAYNSVQMSNYDMEILNYKNVIPSNWETRIKVEKNSIQNSFERISLISSSSIEKEKKYPVKISIEIGKVIISCTNQTGDAKEEIYVSTEGKNLEAGFNPKYFLDALKTFLHYFKYLMNV